MRARFLLVLASATLATGAMALLFACYPAPAAPLPPHFQRGMSYAAWWTGLYQQPEADRSLANLGTTGAECISLIVTCYQETVTATQIACLTDTRTPSDEDLVHVIDLAHSLGMSVMLKPHVDLNDFRFYARYHLYLPTVARAAGEDDRQFALEGGRSTCRARRPHPCNCLFV